MGESGPANPATSAGRSVPRGDTVALTIVNATALEPDKIYLIEIDRSKVSPDQQRMLLLALNRLGVKGMVMRTVGGDGIRIIGVEEKHL